MRSTDADDHTSTPAHSGWRIWRSGIGRLWATREREFSEAAFHADAHRTIDADDKNSLLGLIAEMERRAESAQ